ncbi:MAG: hypothetical protein WD030_07390 [Pirellulales bacterium]
MKVVTTGTLFNGVVKLDGQVDLPNNCRVNISIESVESDARASEAALERFLKRAEERAFDSAGVRFTRDELHERD